MLVSFIPISLFAGKRHAPRGYLHFDLFRIEPPRALLTARLLLTGLHLLSVALFVLVILSGFFGQQISSSNFAPTFVWITWWVGFSFFVAFVGNVWLLVVGESLDRATVGSEFSPVRIDRGLFS